MVRDVMILMRANPFRGPSEGAGPENLDFFWDITIILYYETPAAKLLGYQMSDVYTKQLFIYTIAKYRDLAK